MNYISVPDRRSLNASFTHPAEVPIMPIQIQTVSTRRPASLAPLLCLLAATALFAGCSSRRPPLLSAPIVRAESADASTLAQPVAPLAIDIRNQRGTITVVVDPAATETEVRTLPFRAEPRAARVADIATANGVSTLRVVVEVPEGEPEWTDIIVRTASVRGVIVRNIDGNITLTNVEGPINIQSGEPLRTPGGNVRVTLGAPLTTDLNINTTRGDIHVIAPAASSGQVTLESPAGTIGTVSLLGRSKGVSATNVTAGPRLWRGTINNGANTINMTSNTGQVMLEFVD
jgi:hypothetical protein